MTDAPELIYACYDKEFDATYWVGPDTVYLTRHSVGEYRRADLPRPQDAERIAELEAENARLRGALQRIEAASKFWSEYPDGNDAIRYAHDSTCRLARAALAIKDEDDTDAHTVDASRPADPNGNGGCCERGDV